MLALAHALGRIYGRGTSGASGYPTADILAIHTRASAKWQDVGRTVPAVSASDPVKAIDDISGLGNHWIWASGTVPTRAADGSVVFAAGGSLTSAVVPGATFTAYACQGAGAGNGISVCDPGAEGNKYFQPRFSAANCIFQSGAGSVSIADGSSLAVRGTMQSGGTSTSFVDSTENTFATAASWTGLRIGASAFPWTGTHRAIVLCSGAHSPSERAAWRTLLATL